MTRRTFLPVLASASALVPGALPQSNQNAPKGRLKQSVTRGVFRGREMTLDDMCRESARLGIYGFDLIAPKDWPTLKKYGLTPTMTPSPYGGTISDGINNKENHERLEKSIREGIDLAAGAGCPNVITLSGTRRGMPDEEGADNCVLFLNKVKGQAEDKGDQYLHGAAEQQGESPGLHVRSHGVGRERDEASKLAARQTAL